MLHLAELDTDAQVTAARPLAVQLRPHLPAAAEFLAIVRQQQVAGYVFIGGFEGPTLVVLAGVRPVRTLSVGPHLFVDDLVTDAAARGRGHGAAMLGHLARVAQARGLSRIALNSRDTAIGFYRRVGFRPTTAVFCAADVADLLKQA